MKQNEMRLVIPSYSANEGFARMAVAAFISQLDPTIEELNDIKTAVSEAVTNCIVHAYKETIGNIYISAKYKTDGLVKIRIRDKGCGIGNVELAMQPLYTTGGEERSGLGFSVMESFTDKLKVTSKENKGTSIVMTKIIRVKNENR